MKILELIELLQSIAKETPHLEVYCEDGMDPSDLCPVKSVSVDNIKELRKYIVIINS